MIKTIAPTADILKKYIDCFYIFEGNTNTKFSYIAFPHINTGLSFFKGASIQRKQFDIQISACKNENVHIEILGKYTCPVWIEYTGSVKEISIVFKPLGLNRFFTDNYLTIAPEFSQELNIKKWSQFGENLFSDENDIRRLESFLISQLSENPELNVIEKSLNMFEEVFEEISISGMAMKVGLNQKTFQRHFKKHMGCSPVEYRRICRFRNSLKNKLANFQMKNLTEITYEGGYFDQSYFIKEFRKLTNHNPKDFFKSTSKIDGDKIIWEIK